MSSLPSRPKSGRRKPPKDGLLGRTAVALILQCELSHLKYLEKTGKLVPTFTDPIDHSRWYALEEVLAFAEPWWLEKRKKASKKAQKEPKARKERTARKAASPIASTPIAPAPDYNPDPVRRGVEKTSPPVAEGVDSPPAATAVSERDAVYNPDPVRREVLKPSPVADAPMRTERAEGIPLRERSGADRFDASYVAPRIHAPPLPFPPPPPAPPSPPTREPTRGRVPASIKSTMVINPAWFNEDFQPPPSSER